jgi:DNA-directed RNA polymerase specialized sigma24 family protein
VVKRVGTFSWTWLRWADVDRGGVQDLRAYLVRIVTRQALDQLRTLARPAAISA